MKLRDDAGRYKDRTYLKQLRDVEADYAEPITEIRNEIDEDDTGLIAMTDPWLEKHYKEGGAFELSVKRVTPTHKRAVIITENLVKDGREILDTVDYLHNDPSSVVPQDYLDTIPFHPSQMEKLVEDGRIPYNSPLGVAVMFNNDFDEVDVNMSENEDDGWGTYDDIEFFQLADPRAWYDTGEAYRYKPDYLTDEEFRGGWLYWIGKRYTLGEPQPQITFYDKDGGIADWIFENGIDLTKEDPRALAIAYLVHIEKLPDPLRRVSQQGYRLKPSSIYDRTGWEKVYVAEVTDFIRKLRKQFK